MQEKENILRIFQETKQAIRENNTIKLKELSNQKIPKSNRKKTGSARNTVSLDL